MEAGLLLALSGGLNSESGVFEQGIMPAETVELCVYGGDDVGTVKSCAVASLNGVVDLSVGGEVGFSEKIQDGPWSLGGTLGAGVPLVGPRAVVYAYIIDVGVEAGFHLQGKPLGLVGGVHANFMTSAEFSEEVGAYVGIQYRFLPFERN